MSTMDTKPETPTEPDQLATATAFAAIAYGLFQLWGLHSIFGGKIGLIMLPLGLLYNLASGRIGGSFLCLALLLYVISAIALALGGLKILRGRPNPWSIVYLWSPVLLLTTAIKLGCEAWELTCAHSPRGSRLTWQECDGRLLLLQLVGMAPEMGLCLVVCAGLWLIARSRKRRKL